MNMERLLIAAGAASEDLTELPPGIRLLVDGADEILVMAPSLPSRLQWLASDTDRTRELADERLHEVLGHLDETDGEVSGTVGADDPLLAFEEAVADFRPDHILIALRPESRAGWQEKGLIDQILAKFGLPMTVFHIGG